MTVGEKFTNFFDFLSIITNRRYLQTSLDAGKCRWRLFTIRPIPKHLSQVSGPVSDSDVRIEVSYEIFIHA